MCFATTMALFGIMKKQTTWIISKANFVKEWNNLEKY
jgi:hypothetical protein